MIEIQTDSGLTGYGEVCSLGPFYLPAYGKGVRVGVSELYPHLIGMVPTEISQINLVLDQTLMGHPYVKSGIDMACWDLLGKITKLPVFHLMGGIRPEPSDQSGICSANRKKNWVTVMKVIRFSNLKLEIILMRTLKESLKHVRF